MLREVTMEEISDGRTYELNDMVKADTGNCENCHKCCCGMGNSIVLDPYDITRIIHFTGYSFQQLLDAGYIELNVSDGIILPNIAMGDNSSCRFLDDKGRCSIHEARPGICRLFPLGRVYLDKGFKYFLQKDECIKGNLSKIKIKKWICQDNIKQYEDYIYVWHCFIRYIGDKMYELRTYSEGDKLNEIAMFILNEFYVKHTEGSSDVSDLDILVGYMDKIEWAKEQLGRILG